MNKLLVRQIKRLLGTDEAHVDELLKELQSLGVNGASSADGLRFLAGMSAFLEQVNSAYDQNDRDLDLRTRSLQLSSAELNEVNDRFRALNSSLAGRVEQRTKDLTQALAELEQSQNELRRSETNAALGTLIASVSHELSTPLGISVTVASTMRDDSRSFQNAVEKNQIKRSDLTIFLTATRDGSDIMLRNLERAAELLSTFRQVANDQASGQRRIFDLATMITEVVNTLSPSLKRHPHKIVQQISPDLNMDSWPGALGQIIINLINNAYLHAFDGRQDGVLTISGVQDGEDVLLIFSDNGVGMSPETVGHLFEPFFSTKKGKGGTGLGMCIIDNLVRESLAGTIKIDSEFGVGTTITVRLPLISPVASDED
jgi:signal transduction histidine kinase